MFAGLRSAAPAARDADGGAAAAGDERERDGDGSASDGEARPLSALAEGAESAAALEAHGLEALKAELRRLGLKCGGTLAERAARLFALRGRTRLHAEDGALLPKARRGVAAWHCSMARRAFG